MINMDNESLWLLFTIGLIGSLLSRSIYYQMESHPDYISHTWIPLVTQIGFGILKIIAIVLLFQAK